jgi:formylglycine-generating enzyme required for sulfatase activity
MPLAKGQTLNNRYRIVALLGQGGFGAVYRAWDLNLQKSCAVKENFSTTSEAQAQFTLEARWLANLHHSNLPRVIDHFLLPQGQYLVMDFVEGEDLDQILTQRGPVSPDLAVTWISQITEVLDYLHSQNPPVIHRDIKPANIRITPQGKALLVDFGIAKEYDPVSHTARAARAVTEGFSPPEQYGFGHSDHRADLYALGATLYALLVGYPPPESVQRTIGARLQSPRTLNPAITPAIEAAILKALELVPDARFQSAFEFQRALMAPTYFHTVTPTPTLAPSTVAPALPTTAPKNVLPLAIVAVMSVLLTLVGATWFFQSFNAPTSSPPTEARVVAASTTEPTKPPTEPPTESPTDTPTRPIDTNTPVSQMPEIGPTQVSAIDGMVMVFVPQGNFPMGSADSNNEADDGQKPQHTVFLEAFWIDRTEVTNEKYKLCADKGGCQALIKNSSATRELYFNNPQYSNYPVVYVSWGEARVYCKWAGRRLPTEAEWEKAARGTDGRNYPWGNNAPDSSLLNFNSTDTTPVGSYPQGASAYGGLDMVGNVWEWVSSLYWSYPYDAGDGRENPNSTSMRVVRGGSWANTDTYVDAAFRGRFAPTIQLSGVGFRCAADSSGE